MKLGDLTEKIIRFITLGQGKKAATKIAELRGKEDCGCDRRQKKLNDIGDTIFSFKEPGKKSTINISWKNEWKSIRKQISCSCNLVEGIIELYDSNSALIIEKRFNDKSRLKGNKTNISIEYPVKAIPVVASIKYRKNDGTYTKDVKIKI